MASESQGADSERLHPSGNAVIRSKPGHSEIVVTTTERLAGGMHSLTWGGEEFIDSHDHGRQLQSAASFNCGLSKEFWAECFNSTEFGLQSADYISTLPSAKAASKGLTPPQLKSVSPKKLTVSKFKIGEKS